MRNRSLPSSRRQPQVAGVAEDTPRSPWTIWLYGVPAVALVCFVLHHFEMGPLRYITESLEAEAELEVELEKLQNENEALQGEIEELKPGQFGVEKRAREQLGWSQPGEIIVHLPGKH